MTPKERVIKEAVEAAGYVLDKDITLALDCASSEFYKDGQYDLAGEGKVYSSEGFSDFLAELCEQYPIISIEDGQDESDWDGWKYQTEKLGEKVQLVGDEDAANLPVTRVALRDGLNARSVNCWPSATFDLGAIVQRVSALLPAGFYYKTFIWPNWHWYEPWIQCRVL